MSCVSPWVEYLKWEVIIISIVVHYSTEKSLLLNITSKHIDDLLHFDITLKILMWLLHSQDLWSAISTSPLLCNWCLQYRRETSVCDSSVFPNQFFHSCCIHICPSYVQQTGGCLFNHCQTLCTTLWHPALSLCHLYQWAVYFKGRKMFYVQK
jgi:hypothetical protein